MRMTKRIKRLTAAQKKLVWAEPESNAGAGWHTTEKEPPRRYVPNRERDATPELKPEEDL